MHRATGALERVPGVEAVAFEASTESFTVHYRPPATPERLQAAIDGAVAAKEVRRLLSWLGRHAGGRRR